MGTFEIVIRENYTVYITRVVLSYYSVMKERRKTKCQANTRNNKQMNMKMQKVVQESHSKW